MHILHVGSGISFYRMEIWSIWKRNRVTEMVCNSCSVLHLLLRCCICMVMGTSGMASAEWNISSGDSISWTNCCCHRKHVDDIPNRSIIPQHALPYEVWVVHLLRIFCCRHDCLHLLLLAGDQEHSHWRDASRLETTLVLEEIQSWWTSSSLINSVQLII